MTATETVKQYGETVVTTGRTVAEQLRTPLLAVVGAGDLAVRRTVTVVEGLRSRAEALPGEAQVQADLAAKEARTRAIQVAGQARTAARPEVVLGTVSTLVEAARTQVEALAQHGAVVVDDLRRQPAFRTVVRRAERAVDTVEDRLEDVLEETAEAVAEASNEVTSLAQKTAAKAEKVIDSAEEATHEAAETAKATIAEAEEPVAAKPAKKNSPARTSTPAKTSARVSRARTAKRNDPTAVPAKSTD
jgi:heparin binding hemagglutinin HbhA